MFFSVLTTKKQQLQCGYTNWGHLNKTDQSQCRTGTMNSNLSRLSQSVCLGPKQAAITKFAKNENIELGF